MTPVVDVHTHMLSKEWMALLQKHGKPRYTIEPVLGGRETIHADGAPFMTPVPNMFDWEARIANMNKARVDIANLVYEVTPILAAGGVWRRRPRARRRRPAPRRKSGRTRSGILEGLLAVELRAAAAVDFLCGLLGRGDLEPHQHR